MGIRIGYSRRLMAHNVPRGCRPATHGRAVGWLLPFVIVLEAFFASTAWPQVLAGQIILPDSLGPLTGKTHVAFDESPGHPRMFIGSEDADVLVVDTRTGERMARIQSGPVRALCYSPAHNKLYVFVTDDYGVLVVDCSSYQIIKRLPFAFITTGLLYNPLVDRVYCATWHMNVIDCTSDSIVGSLPINAEYAPLALDTIHNTLYVGARDTFRVIDCDHDSVVASIYELRRAQAVCFVPSTPENKVYVGVGETLFALSVKTDTVVYRCRFNTPFPLAGDPEHNRIYCGYGGHLFALDCANDSIIWDDDSWAAVIDLVAVPEEDKVYALTSGDEVSYMYSLDGATGQDLHGFYYEGYGSIPYSEAVNRVFLVWDGTYFGEGNMRAIDCHADAVVGVTRLVGYIGYLPGSMCVDSVDNKLYFSAGASGVGVVDCSTNRVTSYLCVSRASDDFKPPPCLAYDSRGDRLYCASESSIFVVDCRADTVVKEIPVGGFVESMNWHPVLNKLYAMVGPYTGWHWTAVVIDCTRDTVVKTLGLCDSEQWANGFTLLSPEFNQFWVFSTGARYTVIDCEHDSIVADTTKWGSNENASSTSYSPAAHKVYTAGCWGLYVIDMNTRLPVDSIPKPSVDEWPCQVYSVKGGDKVYWICENNTGPDSAYAVDTRTDSIVHRFSVPFMSYGAAGDRTGDYVYFAGFYDAIAAVDTRDDSTVSAVHLPYGIMDIVQNTRTHRMYLNCVNESIIQVVYDSVIFAGLQAAPGTPAQAARPQTLLNRSVPLRCAAREVLFDAAGRRTAVLKPGSNDISSLAPGVYFIREEPQAASCKPQAVRKVVIAR